MSDGDNTEQTDGNGVDEMVAQNVPNDGEPQLKPDSPLSIQDIDNLALLQDLQVFDHQDVNIETCNIHLPVVPVSPVNNKHVVSYCECKSCQCKRQILLMETGKSMTLRCLWDNVRNYIRSVFDIAIDAYCTPNYTHQFSPSHMANMCKCVFHLSTKDPMTLLMKLVGQAQEFVVEVKVRLLILLHDNNVENLAKVFLTDLLDGYDVIISTALHVSKMIEFLKKEGLCKLNIKWEHFNKKLYQIYVYTDPFVQNNLPSFIQLRKCLPKNGSEYQDLVHRFLQFDDEMTQISDFDNESLELIEKYQIELAAQQTLHNMFNEGCDLFKRQCASQRTCNLAMNKERSDRTEDNEKGMKMFSNKQDIERLLDGWNKSSNQRIPAVVENIICYDKHPCVESLIRPPCSSDPGFVFGYETALIFMEFCSCETPDSTNEQECRARAFAESNGNMNTFKTTLAINSHCTSNNIITNGVEGTSFRSTNLNGTTDLDVDCCTLNGETHNELQTTLNDQEKDPADTPAENMHNSNPCPCVYQHARKIMERKRPVTNENPPCSCLLDSRKKCDSKLCFENCTLSELTKSRFPVLPKVAEIPAQDSIQDVVTEKLTLVDVPVSSPTPIATVPQTRHSTTQTTNLNLNNRTHQDSLLVHSHANSVDSNKVANSTHRIHAHGSSTCHKQHTVEHIKRLPSIDLSSGDGDYSDTSSNQEDSCSSSSSSPRDSSRHCDCCYCEVFGHGVPTVAPVSRNYNEMRERLRQLLSKKRENRCKTEKCSLPVKNPLTQSSSVMQQQQQQHQQPHQHQQQPNTDQKVGANLQENSRLSSAQSMADVDALLNFIEGKQNVKKDDKKAEKKARQKQRKLEEKLKKDQEEEERRKLTEFRKKTPEVTITVVDPQKPNSQRLNNHNRNLPEVSILPASSPVILTPIGHSKQRVVAQQSSKSKPSKNKKTTMTQKHQSSKKSKNGDKKQQAMKKVEEEEEEDEEDEEEEEEEEVEQQQPTPPTLLERFKTLDPTDPRLTKKERKKLRRELRKMEAEKQQLGLEQKPTQIVTIRRVMEANSAEPTVTITLKGQTPAEDKVLYTLVNGQTKQLQEPQGKKKKKKQQQQQIRKVEEIPVPIPVQTSCATCSAKQQLERQQQLQLQLRLQQQQQQQLQKSQKSKDDGKKGNKNESKAQTKKEKKIDKKNCSSENKENVVQQKTTQDNSKGKQQLQQNNQKSQQNKKQKSQVNQIKQLVEQPKSQNENKKKGQQQPNASQKNGQVNNSNQQAVKKNKNSQDNQKTKQSDQGKSLNKQQSKIVPPVAEVLERDERRTYNSNQVNNFSEAKIDIENLKLPPGITITKVDVPTKPIPIKSTPMPKPKTAPKQTAIITAMGGTATGYGGSQNGSNVIVVDTGKLKQDLMPKSAVDKDLSSNGQARTTTISKKKKKKKKKSGASLAQTSFDCVDFEQPARIMHNPTTNMVTIRNPAFGPPKMDAMQQQQQQQQQQHQQQQQQAIIKVSDNGMVTIRSPALQQAINAGLTPPPKPDFIVKGELAKSSPVVAASKMPSRNGLVDCLPTGLSDLANIQISKVANGHPIPENGINLRGTSVTLTKVKTDTEAADYSSVSTTKSKKKKKRNGANAPARGDDWNLVESVFTPKDIDLEDGEMDDAERELEAFKRFCLQSVPPPRKEKVNLNIKDIVLKKKAAAVIAAN